MIGLLNTLLLVGFGVYALNALLPRLDRWLALRERQPEALDAPEPMPSDLLLQARSGYDQEWARDQAVARMLELRDQLGSWDSVRHIMAQEG